MTFLKNEFWLHKKRHLLAKNLNKIIWKTSKTMKLHSLPLTNAQSYKKFKISCWQGRIHLVIWGVRSKWINEKNAITLSSSGFESWNSLFSHPSNDVTRILRLGGGQRGYINAGNTPPNQRGPWWPSVCLYVDTFELLPKMIGWIRRCHVPCLPVQHDHRTSPPLHTQNSSDLNRS